MKAGLSSLLTTEPLPAEFYDWLADTYLHQAEAEWIDPIARLPLNAVFTTSIDPALPRMFRLPSRDVEAVLSERDNPVSPRHRRNLHITYLFGRAGERNSAEAPPKSIQELSRRTALHATPLLARIVETTTSLGLLVIDGLTCGRDWLSAEAFYGVLSAFSPNQVLWFGWNPEEAGTHSELLKELAAPEGPIVFIPERLSVALRKLELANKIEITARGAFTGDDTVTIGESLLEIEPATRLKTSTASTILDDTWLTPLPPLGKEAAYEEFRRFHGHSENAQRIVEGLRRGFAIKRTFEADLQSRTKKALANIGRNQDPVLIHGQSGSGKSLALARLAYDVRVEGRYPVLLSSRVTRVPAVDELDEFCLRAEDSGAEATLLVCDANAPAFRYRDLLRGFLSRGRRVVIVGSTYRIVDHRESSDAEHLCEALGELDEVESPDLDKLLQHWTGVAFRTIPSGYLLPAVYRMLPDVRPRLAAGLAREARVVEDELRSRGAGQRTGVPKPAGALGQALIDAGLVDPKAVLDQKIEDFLGRMSDSASKAIDYVMMPGKLNCPVPINLLMRTVGGSESLVDIATLFSGIDLFRWSTNAEDDVFVHPRLQVEAELIAARRLGTSQSEIAVAIRLLKNANPSNYESCERRFVLELVQKLGPDGPFGRRYANHYLDLAKALTEIRIRRGFTDPSLMLQEATLRRRALRDAPTALEVDPATILEEARRVVDLALDEFGGRKSPGLRQVCANLMVERAAIYGFRAVQQLRNGAASEEVWQFYKAARDSARSAVYAADTYVAIDVSLWIPHDLLRQGDWSPEKRAELVADIWDSLERVDIGPLDFHQRERYEERRVKVAQTLENIELEQNALEALQRIGSKAGIFLQARTAGGELSGRGNASGEDMVRAERVLSFLENYQPAIRDDARCLRYLIRAHWIIATGTYLFGGERSPIPYAKNDLHRILDLLDLLGGLEGALGDPRTQYLRAVLMWRLQREHEARESWRSLSEETAFSDPRRVVRHHIWTEAGGVPRVFQGRVTHEDIGRGRARVQVEEIRQEIEILQKDFPQLDLKRGTGIPGGFHIAFNYIGPVAEPLKRRGGGR
jgi:tetratricopeptide (TPR) repeat protein